MSSVQKEENKTSICFSSVTVISFYDIPPGETWLISSHTITEPTERAFLFYFIYFFALCFFLLSNSDCSTLIWFNDPKQLKRPREGINMMMPRVGQMLFLKKRGEKKATEVNHPMRVDLFSGSI